MHGSSCTLLAELCKMPTHTPRSGSARLLTHRSNNSLPYLFASHNLQFCNPCGNASNAAVQFGLSVHCSHFIQARCWTWRATTSGHSGSIPRGCTWLLTIACPGEASRGASSPRQMTRQCLKSFSHPLGYADFASVSQEANSRTTQCSLPSLPALCPPILSEIL